MELTVGGFYFYDGGDETSAMKAQEVELVATQAFGFEGEVIIRALDGSSPETQMVSEHHLQEV